MTFLELRRAIGATVPAAIESPGYYNLPPMTLSRLNEILGEAREQKVGETGLAFIAYPVAGGTATIIARCEGVLQKLEGGLVFCVPEEPGAENAGSR
jgi:hypothetical protein